MSQNLRSPFLVVVSMLFLSSTLHAQTAGAQEELARALHMAAKKGMDDGAKLAGEGKYSEAQRTYVVACLRFKKALTLSPRRPTTGMALAFCHAAVGKPATALKQFRLAKEWADAQSNAEVAKASAVEITKLETTVPKLRINVPSNIRKIEGLTILRNGDRVSESEWDTAIAVDPGTYTIQVSAPNKDTSSVQYDVPMGKLIDVSVTPPWSFDARQGSGPDEPPPSFGRRPAGVVGLVIGGAALATAGVTFYGATTKNKASLENNHCDAMNACDEIGTSLRTDAKNLANASTVLVIAGGVLALGGIILVATAPSPAQKPNSGVQTSLWLGAGSIGVRGRW